MSDLLRVSINQKDNDLVTIEEELLLVKDYLELEKIRYENRLEYTFVVKPFSDLYKIPKFSIQLLVENAIKHGIDKYVDGGLIEIVVNDHKNFIDVSVKNPGKLIKNQSKGIGIDNLKKRLLIQFSGKANLFIKEESNNIVIATIQIPKDQNE